MPSPGPGAYPPEHHLLRELRFSFQQGVGEQGADGTSHAWMPVVPEICTDAGCVRAGALATLVDVIGGGLAACTAQPDWIATADLTLHLVRGAQSGVVEARARVLRAGRTTVVIEVDLLDEDERDLGIATMSFSRLPRRDINPAIESVRPAGRSTMALESSRLEQPLLDALGLRVVDASAGIVEVPVTEWALNSMGAMQGGVVATIVEAAGEAALRSATGAPLVVSEIVLTYLSFGKVGPLRTRAEVLDATAEHGTATVELVDTGAEHRRTTIARVVATKALP